MRSKNGKISRFAPAEGRPVSRTLRVEVFWEASVWQYEGRAKRLNCIFSLGKKQTSSARGSLQQNIDEMLSFAASSFPRHINELLFNHQEAFDEIKAGRASAWNFFWGWVASALGLNRFSRLNRMTHDVSGEFLVDFFFAFKSTLFVDLSPGLLQWYHPWQPSVDQILEGDDFWRLLLHQTLCSWEMIRNAWPWAV